MRSLYVNEPAVRGWLARSFPDLPVTMLNAAFASLVDAVIEDWSISAVGGIEPPDSFMLTSFDDCPADIDLVPHVSVVLTCGPGMFQTRRVSLDEHDGIPAGRWYMYDWALQYVGERDAKLYARHGLDVQSISKANREYLLSLLGQTPPKAFAIPRITGAARIETSSARDYRLVTPANLHEFIADLSTAECLGFDTETTIVPGWDAGMKRRKAFARRWDRVIGESYSTRDGTGWYLDARPGSDTTVPAALEAAHRALEDPDLPKVGHNIRFDMLMLRHTFDVVVKGLVHDTMIMAWLLGKQTFAGGLGLKERAYVDLGFKMIEYDEITQGRDMGDMSAAEIAPYAAADGDLPRRLMQQYIPQMQALDLMRAYDLETALTPALHHMEWRGMHMDRNKIADIGDLIDQQIDEDLATMSAVAGKEITQKTVRSSQQLSRIMFREDELGFPRLDPKMRKPDGGYSTNKDTVRELLLLHPRDPFLTSLLRIREFATIKTNFADILPDMVNPTTGRIHASWNSTRASTGRLSCSEPNLTNIPARSELGQRVRAAFTGQDGTLLMAADKSQIEVRILAHLSQDVSLMDVYRTPGRDLYREVGSRVYRCLPSEVRKDQRDNMKVVVLASQYGGRAYTISRRSMRPTDDPPFQLTEEEADDLLGEYFRGFPGIPRFMSEAIQFAREHGYAVDEFGQRRWLKNMTHYDASLRYADERRATNVPVQGLAAKLLKRGAVALYEAGMPALCLVHDEYVFEGTEQELAEMKPEVTRILENIYPSLRVPIVVEAKIGPSWAEAK